MVVFTDSLDYADQATGSVVGNWGEPVAPQKAGIRQLCDAIYGTLAIRESKLAAESGWDYLFLVESASQSHYDLLIDLTRRGIRLPDGILCLAGSGERFHGFKGREWSAPAGNIYLAVHLAPHQPFEHAATCFTVLAAVSVLDVVDGIPGLEGTAQIKWVNDILIDGAKVAGVLAYTQSEAAAITDVVLGIGLNVATIPSVAPTPFVPRVGALQAVVPDPANCRISLVFRRLVDALGRNYRALREGGQAVLLDRYRQRSLVIGREIALCSEDSGTDPDVLAVGRVEALSDDLELMMEGHDRRFSIGRVVLDPDH
jgi:BirA family biotin operon repressor/biotin-[acetyl-CoA-carboxylase] ligase